MNPSDTTLQRLSIYHKMRKITSYCLVRLHVKKFGLTGTLINVIKSEKMPDPIKIVEQIICVYRNHQETREYKAQESKIFASEF